MSQTAQAPSAPHEMTQLRTGWGWVLAAGILFVATGLLALVSPKLVSFATAFFFGIMLLISGTVAIVGGLLHVRERGGWLVALLGLLSVIAGILFAFDPFAGALSVVWAIGLWIFVGGVFEMGTAFSVPNGAGRLWLILSAVVDLVLGVLITLLTPEAAIYFLTFFVSASLILRGIWLIALAKDLKGLSRY